MASRQGGGHLFSFLVVETVVLFVLIGMIYVQNSAYTQAVNEKQAAELKVKEKEKLLAQNTEELFKARKIITGDSDNPPPYDDLKQRVDDYGKELSQATGVAHANQYSCLRDVLDDAAIAAKFWRVEFDKQKTLAEAKAADYNQLVESKQNLSNEKDKEIDDLRKGKNSLQVQLEQAQSDARESVSRLRRQLEELEDNCTTDKLDLRRKNSIVSNRLNLANERIALLEREKRKEKNFEDVEPDGRILQVRDKLGYVWLNIGRKERLRTGIRFDVFQYIKGGKRERKGLVEVMSVDDRTAQARIIQTTSKFNPISEGDYIASPFYDAKETPIFAFAGEKLQTPQLSREELVRKIQDYGGKVEDKVTIHTTYVVALEGYENSPQFEAAQKYNITIIREGELLNFLE